MNECHTLTQQNDENPKDKEPGMEIDEAGDILYAQKGKYYIRGITDEIITFTFVTFLIPLMWCR